MTLVLKGTYADTVRLFDEDNVVFYGIDNRKCIIINSLYDGYYHPPFWIRPSTEIRNLTIVCNTDGSGSDAYCIHSDNDGEGSVIIENCNLYSKQHACIGFGTRQNAPLYITGCIMKSENSYVLYGHNSHAYNSVYEELHVSKCYGISNWGRALEIFDANHFYPGGGGESGDFQLYFNDNVFLNQDGTFPICLSENFKEELDNYDYYSKYCQRMKTNAGNAGKFLNYTK